MFETGSYIYHYYSDNQTRLYNLSSLDHVLFVSDNNTRTIMSLAGMIKEINAARFKNMGIIEGFSKYQDQQGYKKNTDLFIDLFARCRNYLKLVRENSQKLNIKILDFIHFIGENSGFNMKNWNIYSMSNVANAIKDIVNNLKILYAKYMNNGIIDGFRGTQGILDLMAK
ncbi:unnamed protein product [Gordionus sp. m RMFG-2023]